MQFLRDILGNKKKYFLQSEIIDVNVPLCPEITVERVLEQIKNIKEFMIYLPDLPEIGKSYIERGFVFAVVNTIDRNYFRHALAELEARRAKKATEDAQ